MAATVGIEGVYRVYLNLASTDPGAAATIGRYLAIFRNRQTADQFYRFAQGAKNPAGQPALNTLTRQGPQFWNYNSVAYGWPIPVLLLEWFPQWAPKVILTLINDEGGRDVSPIPVQAITEWFNGGAYFIKNTLKTEEYWIQNGSYVTLSSHDATKFVVRSKGLAANEILTIDDPITIELASAASSDNPTKMMSKTMAVRGIVELFRLVKREKELHQEILDFSVSHYHRIVRIYGHYPIIDGENTTFYRHPIHTFDFTALDVIDTLPPDINFKVSQQSELRESGLSQGRAEDITLDTSMS
ncbi:hypothetical protein G7Y89_g6958 [Cudoniella acicularis]|uniref:DUF7924 domain-containing protein n=1 Tax=Cudoniella acicularis TaxID=354080 RepID=A0A8H4RLB2_9HELO|nr:hypothetical protein G7Y89_g6958 [Cudoniella acicularis]